MNNIVIRNIEPQNIKISGAGEVIGITAVYVNGVNVTEGTVAYVVVPTKTSQLTNDSGFLTQETDPTIPYYIKNIKLSDINNWNDKQNQLVSGVNIKTVNSNSLLGSGNLDISTSYSAGTGIAISEENVISNTITSYDDLTDLPTIPSKTSDLLNDSDYVTSSELAEVAFNGSYNALSDTPEIPASTSDLVNDGEDGVHPFITNETDGLINYYDKDFLYNLLPKVTDTDTTVNLSGTYASKLEIELNSTELSQEATPTPSSPEDIHVITGSNKVVVCGKNTFHDYSTTTESLMGITISKVENGIKLNGTYTQTYPADLWLTNSRSNTYTDNMSFLKANTQYTITLKILSGTMSNMNKALQLSSRSEDKETFTWNYKTITASNGIYKGTFTVGANNLYVAGLRIPISTSDTITFDNCIMGIQIEEGSGSEYEPYVSQEATIDLGDIEYCKIGTYSDKFIRESDGTWQLEKNIGKVVLDGSETWTFASAGTTRDSMIISIDNAKLGGTSLSNYFGMTGQNVLYCDSSVQNRIILSIEHTYTGVETSDNNPTRKTKILNWLSTHNTDFYYQLATPTYTQIIGTLETQLENVYKNMLSYSGATNILQVPHDLPFTIKATTLKDISNL